MNSNFFDKVRSNFFNPLASISNNRLNSDCFLRIYEQFDNEISYKIHRDSVRDVIIELLNSDYSDTDEPSLISNADKAGAIIRDMKDSGWLTEETDDVTYNRYIILTEEGIALAEFLSKIISPSKTEYSSFVFNIYNLLNNRKQWEKDPYNLALLPIYNEAKQLSIALKKLSTSIREIIEEVVKEESFEELTNNLMSYCDGAFIKEYSRLVKEQNIKFFRGQIIEMLEKMRGDPDDYEMLVIGCFTDETFENEDEARYHIYDLFKKARDFLTDDYNRIINDIQRKINIYLNLAVGRARFLLNHDDNSSKYVYDVIQMLLDYNEKDIEWDTEDLFNIYTQEFIDVASLRYPNKRRAITKTTVTKVPVMTDDDINKAREQQRKEAYNPYDKKIMKKYVLSVMGNKKEISAEEFPWNCKGDVLSIISSAAYCEENGFVLKPKDNYISRNGFVIRDFTIARKE